MLQQKQSKSLKKIYIIIKFIIFVAPPVVKIYIYKEKFKRLFGL